MGTQDFSQEGSSAPKTYRSLVQRAADVVDLVDRAPAFRNEVLLLDAEHVERVVDGLYLAHLDEPSGQVLRDARQDARALLLRLADHLTRTKKPV